MGTDDVLLVMVEHMFKLLGAHLPILPFMNLLVLQEAEQ